MQTMQTITIEDKVFTEEDIKTAMVKSAAIAKAAQDFLTYTTSQNGIPPPMGKFDPKECTDGGKLIESYWTLFNLLHPDQA